MTPIRRVLGTLRKNELLSVAKSFDVDVTTKMNVDEVLDAFGENRRATLDAILPALSLERLKAICLALGVSDGGNKKQTLVERILGAVDPSTAPKERDGQKWLAFPTLAPSPTSVPVAGAPPAMRSLAGEDWSLYVKAEPRKPVLAWQGMWRKEVAASVPTQVVEIVRPGRAIHRGDELAVDARDVGARDVTSIPPNRLIWTNDNLVALQTLLDERDPETRDYRYRSKVDLIYIDPPFMVNSDFRGDNSIEIDLDEDAGVTATKEPSLVEILAYKDTWRQGLDTFLTMMRRRLELLKELLAPTGSIYVHLDWHAVHYVKVLLDELFGYENFRDEIIWKRTFARSDSQGFNCVHDTILAYAASKDTYWQPIFGPHAIEYIKSHYNQIDERTGKRYQLTSLESPNPRPNMMYEWKGYPHPAMGWRFSKETMAEMDSQGLINYPKKPGKPRFKRFLDEDGVPLQSVWLDVPPVNSQAQERLGYPTQKPVALIERFIRASCPPGGLVLDCFAGSGTTIEAAERQGRRWISIDNAKFAVHLGRKRLITLHGQPRQGDKLEADYAECDHCGNIERKEKHSRSTTRFEVSPFTVENMGVYQRAEEWQDFQKQRSRYRDEMIKVFGGEPITHSPLLHGKKGAQWVHVGPLDGPVSEGQVWNIAREAQRTTTKAVTILSADFDTLSASQKDDIKQRTAVTVTIRAIPASAIDEVRRRIERQRVDPDLPVESMAVPAFYAPLSIVLNARATGRTVRVTLERCEIDIESFVQSQRPVLKPITEGMTAAARKKAQAELDKWDARKKELDRWLAKATTWQKFIDFWSIDWDYGRRVSPEGKPIFETDWQSFRTRRSKGEMEPLVFATELRYSEPGRYRIAARVTDVFGNDGIATVAVEVK